MIDWSVIYWPGRTLCVRGEGEIEAQDTFGAESWTAAKIPPLAGRLAVVTGATSEIGFAAVVALARAGADAIVAGHDESEGREAVGFLRHLAPRVLARFEKLDLRSMASVAEFAGRMQAAGRAVDILINQAGGIAPGRRQLTANGFELHLGANYLGHFALTAHLLPLLRRSRKPRVVQMSSLSHRVGAIHFDDLQLERRYEASKAYAQSKLALLMFAIELQRRSDFNKWGLLSAAAHPGYAHAESMVDGARTNGLLRKLRGSVGSLMRHSAVAGAQPVVFAATDPGVRRGGFYGPTGPFELVGPPGLVQVAKKAEDADDGRRLWQLSEQLTLIKWPAEDQTAG